MLRDAAVAAREYNIKTNVWFDDDAYRSQVLTSIHREWYAEFAFNKDTSIVKESWKLKIKEYLDQRIRNRKLTKQEEAEANEYKLDDNFFDRLLEMAKQELKKNRTDILISVCKKLMLDSLDGNITLPDDIVDEHVLINLRVGERHIESLPDDKIDTFNKLLTEISSCENCIGIWFVNYASLNYQQRKDILSEIARFMIIATIYELYTTLTSRYAQLVRESRDTGYSLSYIILRSHNDIRYREQYDMARIVHIAFDLRNGEDNVSSSTIAYRAALLSIMETERFTEMYKQQS